MLEMATLRRDSEVEAIMEMSETCMRMIVPFPEITIRSSSSLTIFILTR